MAYIVNLWPGLCVDAREILVVVHHDLRVKVTLRNGDEISVQLNDKEQAENIYQRCITLWTSVATKYESRTEQPVDRRALDPRRGVGPFN
jgi:hypothetical protein